MDSKRLEEIYKIVESHINFSNYLMSYGDENADLEGIDYNHLLSMFISAYFTTCVDSLIKKTKVDGDIEKVEIEMVSEVVEDLAQTISKYEKVTNKYSFGDLSYTGSSNVIEKVRNKLAHGDFIVEDNNIVYEENGQRGEVNIDSLLAFISKFDEMLNHAETNGKNMKIFVKGDGDFKCEGPLDDYCKKASYISVTDEPRILRKRNKEYIYTMENFKNLLLKKFETGEIEDIKNNSFFTKYERVLNYDGIDLKAEINNVCDFKYYDKIKNNYEEMRAYYKTMTQNEDENLVIPGKLITEFIANRMLKLSKGEYQIFSYAKGIEVCLVLLKIFRDNPELRLQDLYKCPGLNNILLLDIDNAIIASYIVGFNSLYQYGLESGYTSKNKNSIEKLMNNEEFDFSKLDLSEFEYDGMECRYTISSFDDEINKRKKHIADLNQKLDSIKTGMNAYLEHTALRDRSRERLNKFNEKIDKVNNEELSVEQKKLDDSNKFMETFDKEKYTDNFNIITYIRNAISHGNLKINEDENIADISKKKIRIVNEYEGKVYYDKEVSLEQFSTLFSDDNHKYIHNFLTGNIDDGKLKEDTLKEDLDKGKVKAKKR